MRRWLRIGVFLWASALSAAAGCVLGGSGEPGCSEDAECGDGYVCRAGACFHESSGGALVPLDAGDAGDANEEGDAADAGDASDAEDAG